jgi:hypothetical protein
MTSKSEAIPEVRRDPRSLLLYPAFLQITGLYSMSVFLIAALTLSAVLVESSPIAVPTCTGIADCTAQVQSVLDDASKQEILFLRSNGPFVVLPLVLNRSNVLIRCDDDALILAKRWAYNSTGASLLTLREVSNVTIVGGCRFRMWREDYANPHFYRKGEWRMALNVETVSSLFLQDITLEESGGDGIYLGGKCNENVTIVNVSSLNNYRQGMSVICVNGLWVENSRFDGTRGTNPACGVDMEPNVPSQQLTNIHFLNNTFNNNSGCGIALSTHGLSDGHASVSVRLVNSVVKDVGYGMIISIPHPCDNSSIFEIDGLQLSNSEKIGLFFMDKPRFPHLTLKRTVLTNTSYGHYIGPIAFYPSASGVTFDETQVYEYIKRVVIYYQDGAKNPDPDVSGTMTVFSDMRYDCIDVVPKSVHHSLNISCVVKP